MADTFGIFNREHELHASCIFFFSHQRAYYMLVGNTEAGKSTGASSALIDGFIRQYAGQKIKLDFEGSDIPGLARYYSGFGALNNHYPAMKLNRLPLYLKWLKK